MTDALATLAQAIRATDPSIRFTMLEVGAVPLGGEPEPFHRLRDLFPGSQIVAFEVDPALCRSLNEQAPPGHHYYPVALGRHAETRPFYLTRHPMCASLYRPNEALISLYQNFEVAYLGPRPQSTQSVWIRSCMTTLSVRSISSKSTSKVLSSTSLRVEA